MTNAAPDVDGPTGRSNQKARTWSALLQAAIELVREGRPPSMPEAAERALISAATAYRYFPSADELWDEASQSVVYLAPRMRDAEERVDAVGDDPIERLEALVRSAGFLMLEEQAPFRRLALRALERWFDQEGEPADQRVPNRERRRQHLIATGDRAAARRRCPTPTSTASPMHGSRHRHRRDDRPHRRRRTRGGDVVKAAMLDAAVWLLNGALAELRPAATPSRAGRSPASGTG